MEVTDAQLQQLKNQLLPMYPASNSPTSPTYTAQAQSAALAQAQCYPSQYTTVSSTGSYPGSTLSGAYAQSQSQFQASLLLPSHPTVGQTVTLYFDGIDWRHVGSGDLRPDHHGDPPHGDPPPSLNGYTLEQLHEAAAEINDANRP
jgi:hypothetical protein